VKTSKVTGMGVVRAGNIAATLCRRRIKSECAIHNLENRFGWTIERGRSATSLGFWDTARKPRSSHWYEQPLSQSKNNYHGEDNKRDRAAEHIAHIVIFYAAACFDLRSNDLCHEYLY
jgi:hypothetical protein